MKLEELDINLFKNSVPGNVYYKPETRSTNEDAKQSVYAPDKSLYISDSQTCGRGRMGRQWSSERGAAILMSIYLIPKHEMSNMAQITLVAGLAVSRVINGSLIKWPNDVLIGDKKICGILTESVIVTNGHNRIVVGIGVNVNNEGFSEELKDKATSLYLETGKKVNREKIISNILDEFFSLYKIFESEGFPALKDEYKSKCVTLGNEVYIIENENKRIAKAVDITEKGELLIEENGEIECINSREISVRGLLGYK